MISVGLVGTGYWAETVHAVSIAASDDVAFAGVWGRNPAECNRLARAFNVRAFASFEDLVAGVDVVDFSVPPPVQLAMAVEVAEAGKGLLLEKPIALSLPDAERLGSVVAASGVAAVVFIPRFFDAGRVAWLRDQIDAGHTSGNAVWISDALTPGSPYAQSAWRRESGGLWDVGPHVLSQLISVLGPIARVSVIAHESAGETRLSLLHHRGAESGVRMNVNGELTKKTFMFEFSGPRGSARSPSEPLDYVAGHGMALAELRQQIETGTVVSDAWFSVSASVEITRVLSKIDAVIHAGPRGVFVPVSMA